MPTPDRIHLEESSRLKWTSGAALKNLTTEIEKLGYEKAGNFRIAELPGQLLRFFHHAAEHSIAVIYDDPVSGNWVDFVRCYEPGGPTRLFTASNIDSPMVGVLDKPPGVVGCRLPNASVANLHAEFLKASPTGHYKTVTAERCPRCLEEEWAFEMDWRKRRAGPALVELMRVAALSGDSSKLRTPATGDDPLEKLLTCLHSLRLKPVHKRRPPTGVVEAVLSGEKDLVKRFLAAGFDVDEDTRMGSPVQVAAGRGDVGMVNLLLEAGAKPSRRDRWSISSPLAAAAKSGHVEIMRRLVSAGANLKDEAGLALSAAASNRQVGAVRLLLELGAGDTVEEMRQALRSAAIAGSVPILKLLFEAGAKPEQAGAALRFAAAGGHFAAVKFLVASSVDPRNGADYATGMWGEKTRTPLLPAEAARKEGHHGIADFLDGKSMGEEALSDHDDSEPDSGERFLAACEAFEEVQELGPTKRQEVASRAEGGVRAVELARNLPSQDLNRVGLNGKTPLSLAAENGDVEVVEVLLSKGASPDQHDKSNIAPLYYAAAAGHRQVVAKLLAAGANPETKGHVNLTPLIAAAEWGDPEIVKMLLEAGANPKARGMGGQTAMNVNRGLHTQEIRKLLLAAVSAKKGKAPTKGQGVKFVRRKKMINLATASGVQDFCRHFSQPEWSVAIVCGPVGDVAEAYADLVHTPRWERDVAAKNIKPATRAVYLVQLKGSEWTLLLRSLGWLDTEDMEAIEKEARELSKRLKTRAYSYVGEDTSVSECYELYENGESLEKAENGDELTFASTIRKKPEFNLDRFPDPVFSDDNIYLPPCHFDEDGFDAKLVIKGLTPADVVRVDYIVLKD